MTCASAVNGSYLIVLLCVLPCIPYLYIFTVSSVFTVSVLELGGVLWQVALNLACDSGYTWSYHTKMAAILKIECLITLPIVECNIELTDTQWVSLSKFRLFCQKYSFSAKIFLIIQSIDVLI